MKQKIKSKLILCVIIFLLTSTVIIHNKFSVKDVDDGQNSNNDVISDLKGANASLEYWEPEFRIPAGDGPYSVFIGDANNDGYNDIATANVESDDISIFLWNNTISDWNSPINKSVGDYPAFVFVGDANNDGYNDITTADFYSDNISILLWNSTSGNWNPAINKSVGDGPYSVFIRDANNDGYNDIATANAESDDISIFLWNDTISDWNPPIYKSLGDGPLSIFTGDVNNDGFNDIATANGYSNDISIILWNNTISDWNPPIYKSVGDGPYRIFMGDANNDGFNDIATVNYWDNDLSILLWNNTISDWNPLINKSVGGKPRDVFIGDANNDGYSDIAITNSMDDDISIFLWNNTISDWNPPFYKSVGQLPRSIFIGDANNNGYNDIATTNGYDDDISIYLWKTISIISPENKTYTEPMNGYYPATYSFDENVGGEDPINWIVDETGGTCNIIETMVGHKSVIELNDTSDPNQVRVSNYFDPQVSGILEFWWMTNNITKNSYFRLNEDNDIGVNLRISDGYFGYYDSGLHQVKLIENNKWYHHKVIFNASKNLFDWYIDGILEVNDVDFDNPINFPNRLLFESHTTMNDYCTYYDAIGYSWDTNYNIGDNINEGILFSFHNYTLLDWIGYSLDNQLYRTILGSTTILFPPEDGIHTIQVFANNTIGVKYYSCIRYFSVDTSNPIVTITSPSSGDFFGSEAPGFEISVDDLSTNTTWYNLNNGINKTFEGFTGTINQTVWETQGEDLIIIRFYANDSGGLEGYSEVSVYKDITPPTSLISFIPYKESNIINESTTFTITADDGSGSGVSIRQYKINNSGWIPYTGPFDLSGYSSGYYLITYQAIDEVGNVELENTLLVELEKIPSKKSEVIPGYNLFLLISIICVGLIILIEKKWKLLHK